MVPLAVADGVKVPVPALEPLDKLRELLVLVLMVQGRKRCCVIEPASCRGLLRPPLRFLRLRIRRRWLSNGNLRLGLFFKLFDSRHEQVRDAAAMIDAGFNPEDRVDIELIRQRIGGFPRDPQV